MRSVSPRWIYDPGVTGLPEYRLPRLRRLTVFLEKKVLAAIFERRMGVSTSAEIESEELGYDDEQVHAYGPAEWRTLKRALPRSEVTSQDVFVDLGCGLGRVLLMALDYPFKRVIGVELSPQLYAAAEANVANATVSRAEAIEVVLADVREYEVPDDVTFVFLYNPFSGEVFDGAMARVFASFDRAPRRLRIVYRYPLEHERLLASGRVRVVGEVKDGPLQGFPRRIGTITYEVLPAAP